MSSIIEKNNQHTADQIASITPPMGDVLMDTSRGTLVVGDGTTKGGNAMLHAGMPMVFAYLSAAADTTVTTAGTYYKVEGTFVNSPIRGFGAAGDEIEYQGDAPAYFEIDWHASFNVAPANASVHFGVKKNGTIDESSLMETYAAAVKLQASGTTIIHLEKGDTIQLVATSDADADVITIFHFTTSIRVFSL